MQHGSYSVVESISILHTPQPMYNLTVDTAHTFFVGEVEVLVHNDCDFWLSDGENFHKFQEERGLPLKLNNADPYSATANYDVEGNLQQIALYDADGAVVYHIDAPDSSTPIWHYHDFTSSPGNPMAGHGAGKPHYPIGGLDDLDHFMTGLGFGDVNWQTFSNIK